MNQNRHVIYGNNFIMNQNRHVIYGNNFIMNQNRHVIYGYLDCDDKTGHEIFSRLEKRIMMGISNPFDPTFYETNPIEYLQQFVKKYKK
jgi:hypothetical protein